MAGCLPRLWLDFKWRPLSFDFCTYRCSFLIVFAHRQDATSVTPLILCVTFKFCIYLSAYLPIQFFPNILPHPIVRNIYYIHTCINILVSLLGEMYFLYYFILFNQQKWWLNDFRERHSLGPNKYRSLSKITARALTRESQSQDH